MKTEFVQIKNTVLAAIAVAVEEVLPTTKIKKSGIYMIYVDCFDDEKIIPIYVGKSTDIQKRYKSHYQEILALNRLAYDEYKKYTENGLYDGEFKSCKIFRYMVEHRCGLRDYHMVTLEYCDKGVLEDREQFYINKFKSEYFGFNQLNAISLQMECSKARNEKDVALRYITAVKDNAIYLKQYWGYGFTVFNYEYGFYKSPFSLIGVDDVDVQSILKEANTAIVSLAQFANSAYVAKSCEIARAEKEIYRQIHSFDVFLEPIDTKINKQKKLIRAKFKEVLNYSPNKSEFAHFIAGMYDAAERKLFNAALKKKNLRFLAYVRLKDELAVLEALDVERKGVLADVEKGKAGKRDDLYQLSTQRKALKAGLRLEHLFPCVGFQPFVLKDHRRIEGAEENSVLFVVSNNGRISTPEILVVYSNIGGISKTYYVKSKTTTQAVDYIERYAYFKSNSFGKREVYKIIPRNSGEDWDGLFCENHISVLSEYRTGINEFSFIGEELTDIGTIIKELLPLLKTNPKVKLNCTESSRVFCEVLEESLDKGTYKKISEFILVK